MPDEQENNELQEQLKELRREVEYYKQQLDEQSAQSVKQDARISSLRHKLKQKEQGFSVLSRLTGYIGKEIEEETLYGHTLRQINQGLNMDSSIVVTMEGKNTFKPISHLGLDKFDDHDQIDLEVPDSYKSKEYVLVNGDTERDDFIEQISELIEVPYFISVPFKAADGYHFLIAGRRKERKPFHPPLDEGDLEALQAIVVFLSERLEMKKLKDYAVEQERKQAELKVEAEKEHAKHVETELRAETAELQLRAAEAQARALDAEERRKREELERAREVQQSILPESNPRIEGYDIATLMKTATEVGGDYFEFLENGDGSFYSYVGDAAGHGTSAGLMMAMVKIALYSCKETEPREILEWTNRLFKETNPAGLNMALNCAYFQDNTAHISSAGIPPVLIYRAETGEVDELEIAGMPLGAMRQASYDQIKIEMNPNDTLLILSDGLIESTNGDQELLGYENTRNYFKQSAGKPSGEIVENMWQKCIEWMDGKEEPEDDVTLVAIRKR